MVYLIIITLINANRYYLSSVVINIRHLGLHTRLDFNSLNRITRVLFFLYKIAVLMIENQRYWGKSNIIG